MAEDPKFKTNFLRIWRFGFLGLSLLVYKFVSDIRISDLFLMLAQEGREYGSSDHHL
jgi:hypothetical protein